MADFIRGRSIVYLAAGFAGFWARHRATLAPELPPAVTAAVDAFVAAVPELIAAVARPGPG